MSETTTTTTTKPSALDTLRSLTRKGPAPEAPGLASQISDPAIAGAKRDKTVVRLGLDPAQEPAVREAVAAHAAKSAADARYAVSQEKLRDYGASKREAYNAAFRADVTTVAVPYRQDPEAPTDTQAGEVRYVQVVCTNKYSVNKDLVLANRERFGDAYSKLFVESRQKVLKPNAEELIRGLLEQMGVVGEELEASMSTLFDEQVSVSATKEFETVSKAQDENVRAILKQVATRSQPAVKIPD